MKFLLLTLSTTNEKTLINTENIVFTTSETTTDKVKFTRIFLKQVQLKDDDVACVDVKESAEEIYKKLK